MPIVFGAKWVNAVPILILICISAIPLAISFSTSQLLRSLDKTSTDFAWNLLFTGFFVVSLLLVVHNGIFWVAVTVLLTQAIAVPAFTIWVSRSIFAKQTSIESPGISKQPTQLLEQSATTKISSNVSVPPTVIGTQPFVELANQDGQVRRFYLNKERHHLGRDRDWSDLCIPDDGWEVASRHHAVLEKEGTDYRIYDGDRLNPSTNGTFLNKAPITSQEGHLLRDGDQLQIGYDPRNQIILTYSNPRSRQSEKLHS